jgi:hypothetical protein
MSSYFFERILPLLHSLSTPNKQVQITDATPNKGGRPATPTNSEMVAALTWHVLHRDGVFSHNAAQFNAKPMSDAALSERQTALGIKPWTDAMERFLTHTTDGDALPRAFYNGFRLVGSEHNEFPNGIDSKQVFGQTLRLGWVISKHLLVHRFPWFGWSYEVSEYSPVT